MSDSTEKEILKKIEKVRELAKLVGSQVKLAKLVGVTPVTVWKWLNPNTSGFIEIPDSRLEFAILKAKEAGYKI